MNFATFIAFDQWIHPLIPRDQFDGNHGWFVGLLAGGALTGLLAIGVIAGAVAGISRSKRLDHLIETTPIPKTAPTAAGGRNSILKCPGCAKYLSLPWVVFSTYTTKHACNDCGASLVWTKRRMIVGGIAGAVGAPLVLLSRRLFDSFRPAVFMVPVILILVSLIPGQYRLEDDQASTGPSAI